MLLPTRKTCVDGKDSRVDCYNCCDRLESEFRGKWWFGMGLGRVGRGMILECDLWI